MRSDRVEEGRGERGRGEGGRREGGGGRGEGGAVPESVTDLAMADLLLQSGLKCLQLALQPTRLCSLRPHRLHLFDALLQLFLVFQEGVVEVL